jgi:hypothetical protein
MRLDARDRKLLAAFRDGESPPPGVAKRCYDAVVARVDADDLDFAPAPPVPWLRSIALSFAIAAAVLLMMRGTIVMVAGLRADTSSSVHVLAEHVEREDPPPQVAEIAAPSIAPTPVTVPSEAEPSMPEPPTEPPAATTPKKRGQAATDLTADLALLTAAKRATDPAQRLKLLEQHARDHRSSTFAEERDVLTIEALCELRRDSEAKTRASAFLRLHPRSAFAARVQQSCAAAGK